MKALSATLLLLLFVSAAAFAAGEARLKYFRVKQDQSTVVVEWEAELEMAVQSYEVHRRTPYTNGQFVRVRTIPVHGASRPYRFVDDQVYKNGMDEQVEYQLVVVDFDEVRTQLGAEGVNYTSTAARRTWGSIKAMFQ